MFDFEFSSNFKRRYKKLVKKDPNLKAKIDKTLAQLAIEPKYPSLKSHQVLHPDLGKVWSSWVTGDFRILWEFEDDKLVILILKIGGHDEVY